jgi:membrane-associated protease RseP (regulator of RpoE activity)
MPKIVLPAVVLAAVVLTVAAILTRFKPAPGDATSPATSPAEVTRPQDPPSVWKRGDYVWAVARWSRDSYLQDVGRVNRHLHLLPKPGNSPGSLSELLIAEISVESPMYAAGLRKGDRVLLVNGSPIATMERAMNLIHEVRASTSLSVRTEREGRTVDYQVIFE